MSNERHVPVLFQEAIDFLRVRPDGTYVDCTVGLGGHSEGILRRLGPQGHLIGFDRDPDGALAGKGTNGQGFERDGQPGAGYHARSARRSVPSPGT